MTMRMRAPAEAEAEALKEACPVCGAVGDCDTGYVPLDATAARNARLVRVFNGVEMKAPLHSRRLRAKLTVADDGRKV